MLERIGDDDKRVYCAWCMHPFLSQGNRPITLENMIYHDVCFDELEAWWRADNAKQQKEPHAK